MNDTGWVKLHRQMFDNRLWLAEPFTKAQAWIDLFANANHKTGSFWVRGVEVVIERGQIGWSELTMASRWKWSRMKVRRFLDDLETRQQIIQHKRYKITTIITIINYNRYQDETSNDTTERQQKDNRRDTNKNDKNVKNDKKEEERGDESPPTPHKKAEFFFKGITDFLKKEKTPEAEAMGELLKRVSSEQGIESLEKKKIFWDEIVKFGDYWQEKDHLGKREKWQMQKTFEVEKRLQVWLKRAGQWSKPVSQNNKVRGFA